MTYASRNDLTERYRADEIDQLEAGGRSVAKALADADEEINEALRQRYTLPLASVPPRLVFLACEIARYRLYDDAASEQLRERYEDARRALRDIAQGTVRLDIAPAPGESLPGQIVGGEALSSSSPPRLFTRETLA